MCKTITQKVRFRAEPAEVYRLLVTQTDAVGRPFRLGRGSGIVVDLAPAERVVRAWREDDYPEGIFSLAAFTLRPVETGTELKLTHRGVPKELIPATEVRWRRDYWEPMREKLAEGSGRARRPASRAREEPGGARGLPSTGTA